jgi:hypothetical protein
MYGVVADTGASGEEQVAQHAAPSLLVVGCSAANQPLPVLFSNTRMPLQNFFGVLVVEQARYDARRSVCIEGAGAREAGSKVDLVRQIGERALGEWFVHLATGAGAKARLSRTADVLFLNSVRACIGASSTTC